MKSKPLELNDKGAEFCREKCRLLTPPFIYLASIVLPGKEEWGKQGKGEERRVPDANCSPFYSVHIFLKVKDRKVFSSSPVSDIQEDIQ